MRALGRSRSVIAIENKEAGNVTVEPAREYRQGVGVKQRRAKYGRKRVEIGVFVGEDDLKAGRGHGGGALCQTGATQETARGAVVPFDQRGKV